MAGDQAADGPGTFPAQAERAGAREDHPDAHAALRALEADKRERLADERERLADERERAADERERAADLRESAQDKRQRDADEREQSLDQHWRALGVSGPALEQRMLETIERARELLELSRKRLDRQEARVWRNQAGYDRQQAAVDRASAEGARGEASGLQDILAPVQWAKILRKQSLAAIEVFAASEEEAASTLDQVAATVSPQVREQILSAASNARAAAASAREIVRKLTGSPHDRPPAIDRADQTGQESRSAS